MHKMLEPGDTIGILGGGQLGRMMAVAASRLGFVTHIFDPDDIYINNDSVFGVKESLIADFVKVDDADRVKEAGFDGDYYWDVDFDFVLAPKG